MKIESAALLGALPFAAGLATMDGVILFGNDLMGDLLGRDIAGKQIGLFLRTPAVLEAFEQAGREGRQTSARYFARSVPARTLDVSFAPLTDDPEEPPLVLVTCVDVTRENMIEKMRSDFVANASHELRTPLTTLSGFIETMQGAASKDEKSRGEFLTLMKQQADRMAGLINDLLSLSRIELDEHLAPAGSVDLTVVVKQAANLLKPLAEKNGCRMTLDMPDSLMVKGDGNQLAQVLHNLMENALKYAGQDKQVVVSGSSEKGWAVVRVKDDGPGIAAHHLPRLTERFYRVNVQDSRTRGGTGLGLAICKHIVNRHRGKLLIESEVGHGSSFSVHLPYVI